MQASLSFDVNADATARRQHEVVRPVTKRSAAEDPFHKPLSAFSFVRQPGTNHQPDAARVNS